MDARTWLHDPAVVAQADALRASLHFAPGAAGSNVRHGPSPVWLESGALLGNPASPADA